MNLYEVEKTSDFIVEKLEKEEEMWVYDVEVDDNHNFFGNNILVHNSVWGNEDSGNILKAALDSYEDRTISWFSPRTVNVSKMDDEAREEFNAEIDAKLAEDPEGKIKFPSEFSYNGRIIFISNLTEEKFDSAVLNRAAKIDMTLTSDQIFLRMKSILEHMGDPNVPKDVKEEILEFLWDEMKDGNITAPSMRTYVAAEDLYRSGLPNWKELLPYV